MSGLGYFGGGFYSQRAAMQSAEAEKRMREVKHDWQNERNGAARQNDADEELLKTMRTTTNWGIGTTLKLIARVEELLQLRAEKYGLTEKQ